MTIWLCFVCPIHLPFLKSRTWLHWKKSKAGTLELLADIFLCFIHNIIWNWQQSQSSCNSDYPQLKIQIQLLKKGVRVVGQSWRTSRSRRTVSDLDQRLRSTLSTKPVWGLGVPSEDGSSGRYHMLFWSVDRSVLRRMRDALGTCRESRRKGVICCSVGMCDCTRHFDWHFVKCSQRAQEHRVLDVMHASTS